MLRRQSGTADGWMTLWFDNELFVVRRRFVKKVDINTTFKHFKSSRWFINSLQIQNNSMQKCWETEKTVFILLQYERMYHASSNKVIKRQGFCKENVNLKIQKKKIYSEAKIWGHIVGIMHKRSYCCMTKNTILQLGCEVLPHPPWSPELALQGFVSMISRNPTR